MKKIKMMILIIIPLLVLLIYITNITGIPNNIILFENEKINFKTVLGIKINQKDTYKSIQVSTTPTSVQTIKKQNYEISLFNLIPIKQIDVSIIPETKVIPVGSTIGLKLYTSGVLVVGKSEIEGRKPYENTGIEEGDMIVAINEKSISSTEELIDSVNKSNGEDLNIKYVRNGNEYNTLLQPTKTASNEYKMGLWVRDAAAGVGTISYYEPETGIFGALGHGIVDIDTEQLISIAEGEVVTTNIVSIVKGEKGTPR